MLVIVTGQVGVGKTTVCQRVVTIARESGLTCGGVISHKTADWGILVEDVRSGASMPLASTRDTYQGPQTGKYWFNPAGIEFGVEAIRRGMSSSILVVDEIGPLELEGEGFSCATEILRRRRVRDSIVVIRSELLVAFLPLLGRAACIFKTTLENRDSLPEQISCLLAPVPWPAINRGRVALHV